MARDTAIMCINLLVSICCLELDLSGFVGGTPKKSQWITLNIYAMSSSVISHSKRAIEQLCEKHCKEVVINCDEDQSTIGKLNKEEVTAFLTRSCHSVFRNLRYVIVNSKPH